MDANRIEREPEAALRPAWDAIAGLALFLAATVVLALGWDDPELTGLDLLAVLHGCAGLAALGRARARREAGR